MACSHHGDAKEIARRLAGKGYTLKARLQAGFLGVDRGGGRRTVREVRAKRGLKQRRLYARVAQFARASKRYRATARLERMGVQAAGNYGQAIHGTFGRRLQQRRKNLAAVCSSGGKGLCTTSLLSIRDEAQGAATARSPERVVASVVDAATYPTCCSPSLADSD